MTKPWLSLSIVVGLVLVLVPPAWPDYQAGAEAYKRGDYDTAVKEFRLLAEQGHAQAQLNLGIMSSQGLGVPKDYVQAYVWYTLAAGQGDDLAEKFKDRLKESMTLDQLAEAQRLAREWLPKGK